MKSLPTLPGFSVRIPPSSFRRRLQSHSLVDMDRTHINRDTP